MANNKRVINTLGTKLAPHVQKHLDRYGIHTPAEAEAAKLPNYFTGKPCKNGHLDLRRTIGAKCKTCTYLNNLKHKPVRDYGRARQKRIGEGGGAYAEALPQPQYKQYEASFYAADNFDAVGAWQAASRNTSSQPRRHNN